MTVRRAVLWFAWFGQVFGGVLGFAFGAGQVFVGFDDLPLAQQCLRLAVYSNLSAAVLALAVLLRAPSEGWLRWLAFAGVVYHVPAGLDGLLAALDGGLLLPPVFGPAVFHGGMATVLAGAAVLPDRKRSPG